MQNKIQLIGPAKTLANVSLKIDKMSTGSGCCYIYH